MIRMFFVTVAIFATVYGGGLYGSGTYGDSTMPSGGSGGGSPTSSQPTTYNTPKTTYTSPTSESTTQSPETSSPIQPGPLSQEQPQSQPATDTNASQSHGLKTWFFGVIALTGTCLLLILLIKHRSNKQINL